MSVSEYNFGGGNHISGGIAQANVLGVFAEQGVYSANWWDLGNGSTFTNAAQRMYLDYDGSGGHFGDTSVGSVVSDNATAGVHAATDSATGKLTFVLINKTDSSQVLTLSLRNLGSYTTDRAYGFDADSVAVNGVVPIDFLGNVTITDNTLVFTMPPLSVTTVALVPEPSALVGLSLIGTLLRRRKC
jgi:hypothetical protein